MKINELSLKEEVLYKRKHILVEIEFDSKTPSREELKKSLSAKYGSKPESLVIRKINSVYGLKKATVEFMIYSDLKIIEKVEYPYILKRGKKEEAKEGEN